jgi:hypothetical protein
MMARENIAEATLLDALDGVRRRVLVHAGRLPGLPRLRRERTLRLNVVACASILLAFVLAVTATLPLLAVAPVLLGVPHLTSDVRYLLLGGAARPALLPPRATAIFLVTAAALGLAGWPRLAVLAGGLAVLWAGLSRSSLAGRALLLLGAAGAAALALARPHTCAFLLAQGHNAVAVGLAVWLVRGRMRAGWIPAALVGAGIAALALGACDGWLAGDSSALGRGALADALALVVPEGVGPVAARRWVALFAFAQAVHYSAWLHWVPDAARASERPVSFRRSFDLLCAELGGPGARLAVVLSLALPVAALLSLDGARRFYVSVAGFHVFLELAFLAALLAARSREAR